MVALQDTAILHFIIQGDALRHIKTQLQLALFYFTSTSFSSNHYSKFKFGIDNSICKATIVHIQLSFFMSKILCAPEL